MSEIPPGWAEFNDATAVFRGRMVGASGTFSGTFSADVIDAVDAINIRDGAVSAYYGFSFAAGSREATFTIPAQPHAGVVDIIAPVSVHSCGRAGKNNSNFAKASIYRDGVLVASDGLGLPTDSYATHNEDGSWVLSCMASMMVVRYIDLNPKPGASTQYVVRVTPSANYIPSEHNYFASEITGWWFDDGFTNISLLGTIVVGCRKR